MQLLMFNLPKILAYTLLKLRSVANKHKPKKKKPRPRKSSLIELLLSRKVLAKIF
jgi:hypothetical protein